MSSSTKLSKLTPWFAVIAAVLVLTIAFDPPWALLSQSTGTVLTAGTRSRFGTGQTSLTVQLPDKRIVVASAQTNSHYPFQPGEPVIVSSYQTLVFHGVHYEASPPSTGNGR